MKGDLTFNVSVFAHGDYENIHNYRVDRLQGAHKVAADQESLLKSADNCLHSRLCALEKQQKKQRWITSSHAPEMR